MSRREDREQKAREIRYAQVIARNHTYTKERIMKITEETTIWFPGIYGGRTDKLYSQIAMHLNFDELVQLVQSRAKEDGEWAITNGFVGDNEDKMRRMMAFVSDAKNIRQCVEHIHAANLDHTRTVDFVCRDLANASKWMVK